MKEKDRTHILKKSKVAICSSKAQAKLWEE
jgi:hypothetical protein